METKFICLEGFGEIENISDPEKREKKLNIPKKTVRFIRRLARYAVKEAQKRYKARCAERNRRIAAPKKSKPVKAKSVSVLDRCYNADRRGNAEPEVSVRGLISGVRFENGRKYAHCAPSKSTNVI